MIGSSVVRTFAVLLFALGWLGRVSAQQDAPVAFVERSPVEAEVWVGQREVVELRFGVRQDIAQAGLISVFRRPLDLPLSLNTQAWRDGRSVLVTPMPSATDSGQSLVLDGQLARVKVTTQERDGVSYQVAALRFLVEYRDAGGNEASWQEVLAAVDLVLHYATEFELDFLGERVPVDPQRLALSSDPLVRIVRRKPAFAQAAPVVNRLELTATLSATELEVGEEFQVELQVHGSHLPELKPEGPQGAAWVWLGRLLMESEGSPFQQTLRFRFDGRAEQPGQWEIPPFEIARFDPASGSLVVERSQPLTLTVRGETPGAVAEVDSEAAAEADPSETEQSDSPETLPAWIPVLLGAALLALAAWARQTMRRHVQAREAGAAQAWAEVAASGETRIEPLQAWLAAQLGWPTARLSGPGTQVRLQEAGIASDLAEQVASFLAEAEAARYGGPSLADAASRRERLRRALDGATKTELS